LDLAPADDGTLTDEWCRDHFDHLSPAVGGQLYETLERLRTEHPVAQSDAYGGFHVVTRYEDVLRVAQDWESFSSEDGITVPHGPTSVPAIPEQLDPPRHRAFKRLINAYFTPAVVAEREEATRAAIDGLIDGFIEAGRCEFMADFARPMPGLVLFDMVLHAPADQLTEINQLAMRASMPTAPGAREARASMLEWIREFADRRRTEPPRGDVVDAILSAEIEGRPITPDEIVGVIQLLVFGGLDTTAGALGQMMIRFCRQPEIPALLRRSPELIPEAVEELLRLDSSFIFIARTATRDTEVGGCPIQQGERVLISWASANRDEAEFSCPADFDVERESNRHIAFGAGPHRCAGSNLARMNIVLAVTELVRRLDDLHLQEGAEPIDYHSGFSRAPAAVPLAFTPGSRLASA
jgi:cytochrome P450